MYESKIFKVNFDESIKKADFIDGIISISYYFYLIVLMYLFGILMFKTNILFKFGVYFTNPNLYKVIFYIPMSVLTLSPIFFIIKIRKQPIKSIGIRSDKNLKSILLGVVFSLPFVIPTIFSEIVQGKKVIGFIDFILVFLYFLVHIAFIEEISFRGFIQTRIQGLIKVKWLSIIVVGILFGLMHIPFQMLNANMSLSIFIIKDWVHLMITCLIHIYLVYLYTRENNIVAPTITHTLIDFVGTIFI